MLIIVSRFYFGPGPLWFLKWCANKSVRAVQNQALYIEVGSHEGS